MMDGGMGAMMNSMMAWMMGIGLLGSVLVVALLVVILVVLVRLVNERKSKHDLGPTSHTNRPRTP